jgi:CBS-domain-containing membrane protein
MIDKPDKVEERFHMLVRIVGNWGASDRPALAGIIWMAVLLGILLWLDDQHEGIFLVPPFAATMSMLLYLPSVPVAQPFAIVCGSVFAAAIGTALSMFLGFGPGVALVAALTALVLLPLHTGPWFALRVVLPFTLAAVISCAVMCRLLSSWPRYPVPLRTESGRI